MKKICAIFIALFILFSFKGQTQTVSVKADRSALSSYSNGSKNIVVAPATAATNYKSVFAADPRIISSAFVSPFGFETGISLDAMNCLTDLGGNKGEGKRFVKDLNLGSTNFGAGLFFTVNFREAAAFRVEATLGKLSASDTKLSGITDIAKERYNRNLNFQSRISELAFITEIHPLGFFGGRLSGDGNSTRFSPYILGGVANFSFNPQTRLGNDLVSLQPLHTEGEGFAEYPDRKVYKLNQWNIPLGAGVSMHLNNTVNLKAEFVYRKLNTDYLDDVSTQYIDPTLFDKYLSPDKAIQARALYDKQIIKKVGLNGKRGSPAENDGYFSFNFKVSIDLRKIILPDY